MELVPAPCAPPSFSSVSLKGCTLVMPAVAFANVGELAVDVLVASLAAPLVARLDSTNLLACVGNNAYEPQPPGLLATAAELYHVPGATVYLLQQRAPAIPGRQAAFAAELAAWAAAAGVGHLLLLSGLDAQYRREQQLEGPQLRYLPGGAAAAPATEPAAPPTPTPAAPAAAAAPPTGRLQQLQLGAGGALDAACSRAGLRRLEPDVVSNERELHGLLPPWPLLDACGGAGVAHTLLAAFAAEGDNAADGLQLAAKVLEVLRLQGALPQQQQQQQQQQAGGGAPALKVPCSWGPSLFGRQHVASELF